MRRTGRLTAGLLLLGALALGGCKTTEANYKAAYDATRAAQARAAAEEDEALDDNTRRMLAKDRRNAHSLIVAAGDTLEVTTLPVKLVPECSAGLKQTPRYSVVLNAFAMLFNAKAMQQRLIDAGFTGAYVFQTARPDYYVCPGGSDNADEIPAILRRVEAAGNLGQRAGFPAVIRNGSWRSITN